MLISLNWLRDYIDFPEDLDFRALAERLTRTTAEVDGVHRIEVAARGLIAARVLEAAEIPGVAGKRLVTLDLSGGRKADTVSIASGLAPGRQVVYAPVGAHVREFGNLAAATVAGKNSAGMIVPGEAVGIEKAVQEAIFLSPEYKAGDPLPAELFDDWIIEIDNKSITNRPDLWGHYGVAREIAAILGLPLKPLQATAIEELSPPGATAVRIHIADARACPRYSAITLQGVPVQPAPLWMQLRLGHVGQRPISGLVDLTNYVMMDLGQPMHAFDAARVDCIEVDWAADGEAFRTLDGVPRSLQSSDLMIQRKGKSVALAGVMGGLETEVEDATTSLLLESANFHPSVIRKTAKRLGLRTEASARFEKSLDPAMTVLGIQRFVHLARGMYPQLRITSKLSDAWPAPRAPLTVTVRPEYVSRTIGRPVSREVAAKALTPLGFALAEKNGTWQIGVPSFRATGDISIEADVIEEIARRIGYDSIEPALPQVAVRQFAANRLHELEQRTLEYFTTVHRFNEIHGYLWNDSRWLSQIAYDPGESMELLNPAAEGMERLRKSLMPGVLAAVALNRFHFDGLALIEIGSVFPNLQATHEQRRSQNHQHSPLADSEGAASEHEFRHTALLLARRGKDAEAELNNRLRAALSGWAWQRFGRDVEFRETSANAAAPWEQTGRTADVFLGSVHAGRTSLIDLPLRRAMDEHLAHWSLAWSELWLSNLTQIERVTDRPGRIPEFPVVELDFSIVVPRSARYADVADRLRAMRHPLLQKVRFVTSYEGKSVGSNQRSLTFRTVLGDAARTLTEADAEGFRAAFESHVRAGGYEIRRG